MLERGANTSDQCYNEIKKIEKLIKINYETERVGIEKRACETKKSFLKQPSKILIEKKRVNIKHNFVTDYITRNQTKTSDHEQILNDLYEFYYEMMGVEKVDEQVLANYNFKIKKT